MTGFDSRYYRQLISEQKSMEKLHISSGSCVICFNANPLLLDQHHPFGRKNSEVTITVCGNHHSMLSRLQGSWPKDWLSGEPKSMLAMKALRDRALADLLKVRADYLNGVDCCE